MHPVRTSLITLSAFAASLAILCASFFHGGATAFCVWIGALAFSALLMGWTNLWSGVTEWFRFLPDRIRVSNIRRRQEKLERAAARAALDIGFELTAFAKVWLIWCGAISLLFATLWIAVSLA